MELINQTLIAAQLLLSDHSDPEQTERTRTGVLVAKATFDVDAHGRVRLSDQPVPIFQSEEATELGVLPRDLVARADSSFELMVLAAAYSTDPAGCAQRTVTLRVGHHERRLLVSGDRRWVGSGADAVISEPTPFTRMPLTWERAYGGSAEIWVDPRTRVPFEHHYNRSGRGLDVLPFLSKVDASWGCPPGYPRAQQDRPLPNVEDPSSPITRWEDDPRPVSWAPMPLDLGLRTAEAAERLRTGLVRVEDPEEGLPEPRHFAPTGMRFDEIPAGTAIELSGCSHSGRWGFRWPGVTLAADYVVGTRTGSRELRPFQAVLLPDESRLTISYHRWIRFRVSDEEEERSMRLIVEEAQE